MIIDRFSAAGCHGGAAIRRLRIARHAAACSNAALMALSLSGCAETGDQYISKVNANNYPQPDTAMGEALADGEVESAIRITAIIDAHLHNLYPQGQIFRDAHAKADGCVSAKFTISPTVAPRFRSGIFRTPGSYDAVVRFSNSNETPQRSDAEADGRGMAVKVYGLSGTPLVQDPEGPPSQDFIMISHPTFLIANPRDYLRLLGYVDSSDRLTRALEPVLAVFSIGLLGAENAVGTTSLHISNPLQARYWSMVPYQLGTSPAALQVKYSAAPCEIVPEQAANQTDPDYLRHAMAASLAPGGKGACMKFMVQPRTSTSMSVEDSRYEWSEADAPFTQVATITIPAQTFDTARQNDACERLSFSPWHALPEHKPLGAVNRMRKVIYNTISAVRRETLPPLGQGRAGP